MAKKTVMDVDVKGKRVLVRVDYNVPLNDAGEVADDKRITASLPTVNYLLEHGARVILCSHLGRPKGEPKPEFSLKPVAVRLAQLLPNVKIGFAEDCIGPEAKRKAMALNDGEILLLENLRFHKEEEKNDSAFAKELASLAELYVSDAFGTVHRAHASTAGVAAYLPAVAGFLIGKELSIMGDALEKPERPFVAILGGAKVADKIGVIKNLLQKCDTLIIGGGMAYTFFKAMGYEIGDSLLDADSIGLAGELMAEAKERGVKLLLPVDTVVADNFSADAQHKTVKSNAIPAGWQGLDIGEETRRLFAEEIKKRKPLFGTARWACLSSLRLQKARPLWQRPVQNAEADDHRRRRFCFCGKKLGFADRMTHISTGGGASLEFLEGKILPGVAALNDK